MRQPRVGHGLRGSAAAGGLCVYLILNAFGQRLDFELPPTGDGVWRRWIDTALESSQDIVPWPTAPVWPGDTYRAAARFVVVLFGDIGQWKLLSSVGS